MNFYQFFQRLDEIAMTPTIEAEYMAADGHKEKKTFTGVDAAKDAKEFIVHWVGENPELSEGGNYAVSIDGMGRVRIKGAKIRDLMAKPGWREEKQKQAKFLAIAKKILIPVDSRLRGLGGEPLDSYEDGISAEDLRAHRCWDFNRGSGDNYFRVCYSFGKHIEWKGSEPVYMDDWQIELDAFRRQVKEKGAPFSEKRIVPRQEDIMQATEELLRRFEQKMQIRRPDLN